jgi:hypothetical protein
MWTAMQLTICGLFILAGAFWLGRFFGKRKYLKLYEEMKALELSFNQLVDEMELASQHNMQVFTKQSEDLSELLNIADKKILQVNDYLQELDNSSDELKRKSIGKNNSPMADPAIERRLRHELKQIADELSKDIELLESQVVQVARAVKEEQQAQPPVSVDYGKIRYLIEEEVAHQVGKQLAFLEQEAFAPPQKLPARPTTNEPLTLKADSNRPGNIAELKKTRFVEEIKIPGRHSDKDLREAPPKLPASSPVHDVLRMAENGVTLPQIARTLGMGKGEIELILKIYGSRLNVRNVV